MNRRNMDYFELLERSLKAVKTWHDDDELTRAQYLSDHIFDFTTYDQEIAELFAKKAVEVCQVITSKTNFDYIKDEENYKWYLIMCNMPFFYPKLEWGTSIRGAWWNIYDKTFKLESCGLVDEHDKQILEMTFNENQWKDFIEAMAKFIEVGYRRNTKLTESQHRVLNDNNL